MASVDIPKHQKAAVRVGNGPSAKAPVQTIDFPTPGPDEILVKINWYSHRLFAIRVAILNTKTGQACVCLTNL